MGQEMEDELLAGLSPMSRQTLFAGMDAQQAQEFIRMRRLGNEAAREQLEQVRRQRSERERVREMATPMPSSDVGSDGGSNWSLQAQSGREVDD